MTRNLSAIPAAIALLSLAAVPALAGTSREQNAAL